MTQVREERFAATLHPTQTILRTHEVVRKEIRAGGQADHALISDGGLLSRAFVRPRRTGTGVRLIMLSHAPHLSALRVRGDQSGTVNRALGTRCAGRKMRPRRRGAGSAKQAASIGRLARVRPRCWGRDVGRQVCGRRAHGRGPESRSAIRMSQVFRSTQSIME